MGSFPEQTFALKNGALLTLRAGGAEDSLAYSRLLHACGGETDNLSFGAEDCPYSEDYCRTYLQTLLEAPHSLALLAFVGGELVGELTLQTLPRRMSHTAELGICILKAYWGQGIGQRLMETALDFARGTGKLRSIFLTMDSENGPAYAL